MERRVVVHHTRNFIDNPSALLVSVTNLVKVFGEQDVMRQDVVLQDGSQALGSEGREQEHDELFGQLGERFVGGNEGGHGWGTDKDRVLGLFAFLLGELESDRAFTANLLDSAGESGELGGEQESGVENRRRREQWLRNRVQVAILRLDVVLGHGGVEVQLDGWGRSPCSAKDPHACHRNLQGGTTCFSTRILKCWPSLAPK